MLPSLVITQYRGLYWDEDSLDTRLIPDPADVAAQLVAEQPDELHMREDESHGAYLEIAQAVINHGDSFECEGRLYLISITPIPHELIAPDRKEPPPCPSTS
jgi:hypothetical protein